MADYMTAQEGAELIHTFVDLDLEDDIDELLQLLHLVQIKAWKKGVFRGFVKDAHVNVRHKTINGKQKAYVINPHGYEIMLGVNMDSQPKKIRDNYFQFHQNADGSISDCCGCNWTDAVVDHGESPVISQPANNRCCCGSLDCKTRKIGVVGYTCTDRCDEVKDSVTINGTSEFDNPVWTYLPDDPYAASHELCKCLTEEDVYAGTKQKRAVSGAVYPVKRKLVVLKNINWSSVSSIRKTYTDGPVEVVALDCNDNPEVIARLEPYQQYSRYRTYELPDCCCEYECIHALFKVGKPHKLSHPSQPLIIDDEEAIIALAKSMDLSYNKEELEKGEAFLTKGIQNLDDEQKMNRSNAEAPVVVNYNHDDLEEMDYWN